MRQLLGYAVEDLQDLHKVGHQLPVGSLEAGELGGPLGHVEGLLQATVLQLHHPAGEE